MELVKIEKYTFIFWTLWEIVPNLGYKMIWWFVPRSKNLHMFSNHFDNNFHVQYLELPICPYVYRLSSTYNKYLNLQFKFECILLAYEKIWSES